MQHRPIPTRPCAPAEALSPSPPAPVRHSPTPGSGACGDRNGPPQTGCSNRRLVDQVGHRDTDPLPHTPDAPAPAFTSRATHWKWSLHSNNQANATVHRADEPAGTLFFGHLANECTWIAEPVGTLLPNGPEAAPEPIRITTREAGILKTLPADYPWQGNKGQQFPQIGNAVPPLLAGHLLAPHLRVALNPDDSTLAS